MSLNTKIEKLNGKQYYRCLWSGVLTETRYGIPKDKGGSKGSFVDPCCAVSWVISQRDQGNFDRDDEIKNKEKSKKYLRAIYEDLNLSPDTGRELVSAPLIKPMTPDWSYKKACDHMMHPRSGFIHISQENVKSKSSGSSKSGSADSKPSFHLYTLDVGDVAGDGNSFESFLNSAQQNAPLAFPNGIHIRKLVSTQFRGKQCYILSEETGDVENSQVSIMFKKQGLKLYGRVHLLMPKALHEDGATESGKVALTIKSVKKPKESKEVKSAKIDKAIDSVLISNDEIASKIEQTLDVSITPKRKRSKKGQ